jgi:hypothetical protein
MKVTKDKYELPVIVADSIEELSEKCDVSVSSIYSAISHSKRSKTGKSMYRRVVIEDD